MSDSSRPRITIAAVAASIGVVAALLAIIVGSSTTAKDLSETGTEGAVIWLINNAGLVAGYALLVVLLLAAVLQVWAEQSAAQAAKAKATAETAVADERTARLSAEGAKATAEAAKAVADAMVAGQQATMFSWVITGRAVRTWVKDWKVDALTGEVSFAVGLLHFGQWRGDVTELVLQGVQIGTGAIANHDIPCMQEQNLPGEQWRPWDDQHWAWFHFRYMANVTTIQALVGDEKVVRLSWQSGHMRAKFPKVSADEVIAYIQGDGTNVTTT